ncbi:MAG: hypothetical protein FJ395_10705 [Verrucomicrobia bacterium]|nr:hypothetical protein [Verrucomicrobiota bacterium]
MIDLEKFYPAKRRRLSALLGLALDGSRLDGVLLRRTNGSLQLMQSFSVTLSLDPLTADPELVAREIRNHLDAAGIKEHHCAVCLPLKWALSVHSDLPDLPETDVASFLAIEAERGFPCDVGTLRLATSRSARRAAQIGLPANQLAALENILRRAKLKPVSFSLGIAALQPPEDASSDGVLALAIGETQLDLQVTAGGGVVALRTLEGAFDRDGGQPALDADLVARELRITLGQLPAEARAALRRVRLFGPRDLARQLADALKSRLESLDLPVEQVAAYSADDFGLQAPSDAPVSRAFSLAARQLARREAAFEFLPPQVTVWQQLAARYSSGRWRMIGAASAAVVVLIGGPFLVQQIQLMTLRARWDGMSAKVAQLENVQRQIRQYRPWFDSNFRSLRVLRQLSESFPEDGSVTAKNVEIRDQRVVTCSGVARDNAALLRTLGQLRGAKSVSDVKVSQIRGKKAMQFVFDFRWQEGGRNENP